MKGYRSKHQQWPSLCGAIKASFAFSLYLYVFKKNEYIFYNWKKSGYTLNNSEQQMNEWLECVWGGRKWGEVVGWDTNRGFMWQGLNEATNVGCLQSVLLTLLSPFSFLLCVWWGLPMWTPLMMISLPLGLHLGFPNWGTIAKIREWEHEIRVYSPSSFPLSMPRVCCRLQTASFQQIPQHQFGGPSMQPSSPLCLPLDRHQV